MFRTFFYLLMTIVALTLLRSIMGVIMKGVSDLMNPSQPQQAGGPQAPPQSPPRSASTAGGELKRDPVCGTYIPVSNSVRKTVNGELLYFCSPECRDRYPG